MEYRVNFLAILLPTGGYTAGYIVLINTIFQKVRVVSGWTFDQMLGLFAVEQLFFYLSFLLFRHSLDTFSESVRNGDLDSLLKMPRALRLMISFRNQESHIIVPMLFALCVLLYSVRNFHLQIETVLMFVFLMSLGCYIFYNTFFSLATTAFWTTEANEVFDTADELTDLGRFPLNFYHPILAGVLLVIFPIVLIVYTPATALLNILDYKLVLLLLLMVVISKITSDFLWNTGLRHYSSASS